MSIAAPSPFPDDAPDWEHAVEMFFKSVQLAPDNLAYRQSLRGAEFRLKKQKPVSTSFSTWWKRRQLHHKFVDLDQRSNWDALDLTADEAILLDPWDPLANAYAAKACVQRGYNEVGRFLLECALMERLKTDSFPKRLFEQMKSLELDDIDWPGVLKIAKQLQRQRWR